MNKSWKSRYFILNKYKQMKYYETKERTNFLGLIDLNLCILININSSKSYGVDLTHTIEIQTPNRTWIICAATKKEKYEWQKIIKAVRWEKLNEQTINNMIQMNLIKHHSDNDNNNNMNMNLNININADQNMSANNLGAPASPIGIIYDYMFCF